MGCCVVADSPRQEEMRSAQWNPIVKRSCTDVLCLTLFIIFWIGVIAIGCYSFYYGQPSRIVYGYDSYGNICGEDNNNYIDGIDYSGLDMSDRTYVFFMNPIDFSDSLAICVEKCPDMDLNTKEDVRKYAENTSVELCKYGINSEDYELKKFRTEGPCPKLPVSTSFSFFYRCVPSDLVNSVVDFLNSVDTLQMVISDLYVGRKQIAVLCFVALVLAVIIVLCIRFLAPVIVWLLVILTSAGFIVGTLFLWWTWYTEKQYLEAIEARNITVHVSVEDNVEYFLIYSIIATIVTVILLLIILAMIKRLRLVTALFSEAGNVVTTVPCILLQPFWTFIMLILFFMLWTGIMIALSTADNASMDPYTGYVYYDDNNAVSSMWWYMIIALIWTTEFILACQEMTIAGAVVTYYFTRDKSRISAPVIKSIGHLIYYHLGSVALGSFIITMIRIPRLVLTWVQNRLKGGQNKAVEYCLSCCQCCLWCMEKCMKFLNENAYIVIAIDGVPFFVAAQRAFTIILSNVLRVAAINSVGDFILFLGKVIVVALTGIIGLAWMKDDENLHFFAIPVLLACIFAFFIAHCFLSVYEMIIDTLLICFCEDCRINDGSSDRQYYMSTSLMKCVTDTTDGMDKLKRTNTDNTTMAQHIELDDRQETPEPVVDDTATPFPPLDPENETIA